MLHISYAWSYYFCNRETSGALYHLEPTKFEIDLFFLLALSTMWDIFCKNIYLMSSCRKSGSNLLFLIEFLTLVVFPLPFPDRFSGRDLAMPKSPILTLMSAVTKKFEGLISLWTTLSWCKNLTVLRRSKTRVTIWCSSNVLTWLQMTLLRSYSKYSMTMKTVISSWSSHFGSWEFFPATIRSKSWGTYFNPSGCSFNSLSNWISLISYKQWYSFLAKFSILFIATFLFK